MAIIIPKPHHSVDLLKELGKGMTSFPRTSFNSKGTLSYMATLLDQLLSVKHDKSNPISPTSGLRTDLTMPFQLHFHARPFCSPVSWPPDAY